MRTWIYAGIAVLAFWIPAGSSSAGTLEVSFAFDQGTITFGVPGAFVSQATSFSGTGRVVLTGVDSLGMLTGPGPSAAASVRDVSLVFTGPAPTNPQTFRLEQEGVASGIAGLSAGVASVSVGPSALMFRLTNQAGGSALLSNPAIGASVLVQSLGTPGSATAALSGFFPQVGSTGAVQLDIRGREFSRRFSVPEGAAIQYLAMSLVALAGGATWGRRRRRLG